MSGQDTNSYLIKCRMSAAKADDPLPPLSVDYWRQDGHKLRLIGN